MVNQVILVGRLTNKHILEERGDKVYSKVTIATTRNYKNTNGEYDIDLVDVVLINKVAQSCVEHCKQGDVVGVKGNLQRLKDKDLEVHAEKITFLSSNPITDEDGQIIAC